MRQTSIKRQAIIAAKSIPFCADNIEMKGIHLLLLLLLAALAIAAVRVRRKLKRGGGRTSDGRQKMQPSKSPETALKEAAAAGDLGGMRAALERGAKNHNQALIWATARATQRR